VGLVVGRSQVIFWFFGELSLYLYCFRRCLLVDLVRRRWILVQVLVLASYSFAVLASFDVCVGVYSGYGSIREGFAAFAS
jgi:hypothetical protein